MRFLQKQRARKTGIPALPTVSTGSGALHAGMSGGRGGDGGGEDKEEQVLQDTFAQETAVTIEDPNMYASIWIYIDGVSPFSIKIQCNKKLEGIFQILRF